MSYLIKTGYSYATYYYDILTSMWPVSWLSQLRSIQATLDTAQAVEQIVQHMYQQQNGEVRLSDNEFLREIKSLNYKEDILAIIDDMHGLNILQHGIIVQNKTIVGQLLDMLDYSPKVECNSPTHLAASLGHGDILKCLVKKRPFDLYKKAGLCYPSLHRPVTHNWRMGFILKPKYKCEEKKLLAIEWAIANDHLDCMRYIIDVMKEMGGRKFNVPSFLHFAACNGAKQCLEFLVKSNPDQVNHKQADGDGPLLETVAWGRQCAKVLIDNGADVSMVAVNGDTALHRLYRNDIDGIFAIFDTTQYLLTTGIEQLINTINLKGETALHLLVTHVSYIGGNYCRPEERSIPRWQLQPDYQEQVIKTIQLLLSYNADPHIFDSLHLQPLNKLLHVTMKTSQPTNTCECIQGCINSKYVYRNDFGSLARAIDILLQNGADVNTQCAIGHTPLILLVQALLNTEVPDLVQQDKQVLNALEVLLKNGAKCNIISEDKKTCCSLLAEIAKKNFRNRNSSYNSENRIFLQKFAELVNNILVVFLKYGLNPNYTTMKKSPYLSGGSGNGLIEFVRIIVMASNSDDRRMICMWLRTLLQWGADPDIESYPSEPIICHSQSSIFLKAQSTQAICHYINEVKELQVWWLQDQDDEVLRLFYNAMDHKILFNCLTTACFMTRLQPMAAAGQMFLKVLNGMAEQPRTLKQMARVAIYKAVGRKIFTSVDALPLPTMLKLYLRDML